MTDLSHALSVYLRYTMRLAVAVLVFLCGMPRASAGSKSWLTITNPGFEDQVLSAGSFNIGTPPGWSETTSNGPNSFTENIAGFSYDGVNHEGIQAGEAVWQDLPHVIQPNTNYALIVAVGNRNATYTQAGNASVISLEVRNGVNNANFVTSASLQVNASTIPVGTFKNYRVLWTSPSNAGSGDRFRIRLQVNSGDRAHFDSVQLIAYVPHTVPAGTPTHAQSVPWAQAAVPVLSSRPGAAAVILLDFDGAQIDGVPEWHWGESFYCHPSGLAAVEMRRAFEVIKEDYLPFNVNVTTDQSLYDAALPGRRMRCIFTPTDEWVFIEQGDFDTGSKITQGISPSRGYLVTAGGAENLESFRRSGRDFDRNTCCFAFIKDLAPLLPATPSVINCSGWELGGVASHELGHTMGLVHDGVTANPDSYFRGLGAGGTIWESIGTFGYSTGPLWAPIMGGWSGFLTQWSRGEYQNAANATSSLQDDIAIIGATGPGTNNFGFAADDHGDTLDSATTITLSGTTLSASGFIGYKPGTSDQDYVRFNLPAPAIVSVLLKSAEPFTHADPLEQQKHNAGIANLRAVARLYGNSRSLCCASAPGATTPVEPSSPTAQERLNPTEYLRGRINSGADPGNVWLSVEPVSSGNPETNGFSNYGNLGAWSLTGTVTWIVPAITSPLVATGMAGQNFGYSGSSSTAGVTWSAVGLPIPLTMHPTTGVISGIPTGGGQYNVTLRASTARATGEATLVLTITTPAAPAILSPTSDVTEEGLPYTNQIVASGAPTSYGVLGGVIPGLNIHQTTGAITGTPTTVAVWSMTITATNSWGTTNANFTLDVRPGPNNALDTAALAFSRPDAKKWFGQYAVTADSIDALQAPALTHGEQASIETTVTGPGTISWDWRTDSEPGDVLSFRVGTSVVDSVSGNSGWQARSYAVPAGVQTLRWTFARDASGSGGGNTAFLDRVSWSPATGPVITSPLVMNLTCGIVGTLNLTSNDPATVWSYSGTLPPGAFFVPPPSNVMGAAPTRPGVTHITLFATNSLGTTSRVFTFNIESSYAKWARDRGLGAGSELADPDKDGISNIAELAFALDPSVRNAPYQPVTYDPVTRRLRATFRRQHQYFPDLMYEVQVSTTLGSWTTIARSDNGSTPANLGALSITETQVGTDPIYQTVVTDAVQSGPSTPRRMMRVKITQL